MKRLPITLDWKPFESGRDAEIRTRGLTHPKGARYQAAPRPVKSFLVSPLLNNCQIVASASSWRVLRGGKAVHVTPPLLALTLDDLRPFSPCLGLPMRLLIVAAPEVSRSLRAEFHLEKPLGIFRRPVDRLPTASWLPRLCTDLRKGVP